MGTQSIYLNNHKKNVLDKKKKEWEFRLNEKITSKKMNLSHERLHWDNNMSGDKFSLNPQWLLGLIDADGCFCIIFSKKRKNKLFLCFDISGDHYSEELFKMIKKNFVVEPYRKEKVL